MIQEKREITFKFLIGAIDKRWLFVSTMLLILGRLLLPESALYDAPLTLNILQVWLISIGILSAGTMGLIKTIMNADFNK